MVNNVGVGSPLAWEPKNCYKLHAGNIYPIVLLTQQFLKKFEDRFAKTGKRSIVVNLSSQAALTTIPILASYGSTKLFDFQVSRALGYETARTGVDVLSVLPGLVSTPLTGEKVNALGGVISAQDCARGMLDNALSEMTFGGKLHEVIGTAQQILIDFLP